MRFLSILITKCVAFGLKCIHRGGSFPGSLACKIDPDILNKLSFQGPVILVTGTNGKTSTSNMIADLLNHAGYKVITNRKGDNLKAGIVTTLLTHASLSGGVKATAVVLEVDELNVRHVLPYIPVSALVVNNFFRDQLDRAKEMEQLIESIESVLSNYDKTLILNGNDPNTVRLSLKAPKANTIYFGLDRCDLSVNETTEASEGKFCPKCGHRLAYDYYQYSHIGAFSCTHCDFGTPTLDVCLKPVSIEKQTFLYQDHLYACPYEGMYSMYNCAAMFSVARLFHIEPTIAEKVFEHAPRPAGRNEHFEKDGKLCVLNLVKNPTGANEVMKVIEKDTMKKVICVVLNDREQDGTDVSWIYDTQFERLFTDKTIEFVCTGLRANDMALRIFYGQYQGKITVKEHLDQAVEYSLSVCDRVYVVATYTALLPSRQAIIKGMSI